MNNTSSFGLTKNTNLSTGLTKNSYPGGTLLYVQNCNLSSNLNMNCSFPSDLGPDV